MQASNRLKAAFAQGRQSMGSWQMLPGANVSRALARADVDWVVVDCEHGNIDGVSKRQSGRLLMLMPLQTTLCTKPCLR